jgi:alpha/beta superfamily hydrolase
MCYTYSRLAEWAKVLVQQGFAVLRFHPYGSGESDGTFRDFTLESACCDAVTVVEYLRRRTRVKRVGLFGMRFGGFVAVRAASLTSPDFLLLWSPVINLRQYARNLFRIRLTAELLHHQYAQVNVTSGHMIRELKAGRSVDLLGYELSPEFYHQMSAQPSYPDEISAREVLWLDRPIKQAEALPIIARWKASGCSALAEFPPVPEFWEQGSLSFIRELAETSSQWLTRSVMQAERV